MSYFFIINPGSHQQRGGKFIPELLSVLKHRGIMFHYKLTNTLDEAYHLSREANTAGCETIVAVGGDGTINKVINGFYDAEGKRVSKAKLGVIHTGTSPDFCKSYGVPTNPSRALGVLIKGFSCEIPIARIEYCNKAGESVTGYYACCASFGLGAQVAGKSNSGIRGYLGDNIGTFASIISSLCGYKPNDLSLICDGVERQITDNYNTFIGKTKLIASGLKVANNLSLTDDRLYILSIKGINLWNLVPALKAVYSGKSNYNKPFISLTYAKTIEIKQHDANNEIEFDGDPQGYLPCKISIACDKLELITHEL